MRTFRIDEQSVKDQEESKDSAVLYSLLASKKRTKPGDKMFNRFVEGDISIQDYIGAKEAVMMKATRGKKHQNCHFTNKTVQDSKQAQSLSEVAEGGLIEFFSSSQKEVEKR